MGPLPPDRQPRGDGPAPSTSPRRSGTVYGAESLTLQHQVRHIGETINRPIPIEHISDELARAEVGTTRPPVVAEAIVPPVHPVQTARPPHPYYKSQIDNVR